MSVLLFGRDEAVAQWVARGLKVNFHPPYVAVGVLGSDGALVGGAVFNEMTGRNVDFTYYGPGTLRRDVARKFAHFAFVGLKVLRVTCRTRRRNRALTRTLPKLGFRYEGTMRCYYGASRGDDGIQYGLLASDAGRILRGGDL